MIKNLNCSGGGGACVYDLYRNKVCKIIRDIEGFQKERQYKGAFREKEPQLKSISWLNKTLLPLLRAQKLAICKKRTSMMTLTEKNETTYNEETEEGN